MTGNPKAACLFIRLIIDDFRYRLTAHETLDDLHFWQAVHGRN
jgi:hypothetical protein